MDFPTFQKSVDSLIAWRKAKNEPAYVFPDSRDPEFQPSVTSQEYEQAIVCLCAWRENREDLYVGMMAIVQVINNRAKKGWFGGNLYQNVIHKNQFSSMTIPNDVQLELYPKETETEFDKLLFYIDGLYAGTLVDKTDDSVYYANLANIQKGGWFERTILTNPTRFPRTSVIGRTTFFRQVD